LIRVGIECESIEDQSWGVGRIVKKLLEEISRRPELQKEFRFFLYFKSKIPNLPYLNSPIFVKKIIKLPLIPPSFSIYYYLLLPIKLYFEKLDLMFFPNYMLPIIFKGKSLVILTEDIYYEFKQGVLPRRYKLAYRIFANWAAKRATKIMAISGTSKSELTKLFGIKPERIAVNQLGVDALPVVPKSQILIPNEISSSKFPAQKEIGNWKLEIGNYILYIGQAFPRRHLRETMLAYEKIAPRFPGLKLIAVGKDKYNPPVVEELKNEINRRLGYDGIIRKDYVPEEELQKLYAGARALVYVSSKEAFGLPPLEALAHGTVPIVADTAVAREVFGDAAFFVKDTDSPDSIAQAIAEGLMNDKKREKIKSSAGEILQKYTWSAHTDRFIGIVRNLLAEKIRKKHF
jgi:glycosyltransferase involved in cell wall biosynthesis